MKTEKLMLPLKVLLFSCFMIAGSSCESDAPSDALVEESGAEEPNGEEPAEVAARTAAKQLFETVYMDSKTNSGDMAWTGDEPACDPGSVPQEMREKIMDRLSYFRQAVGLTNTISENNVKSEKAQAAALMMDANNMLDHFPPDSWKCYTDAGREAAGKSLLTTAKNAEALDSYMRDAGSNNGPVGHRRWLLWPRLQEIGVGNTAQANAIWVIGNAGSRPADGPEFISWPPKGYVPRQFAYPRWSFSVAGADFSNTQVKMKDATGNNLNVELEALDPNYGDATIVWVPQGVLTNSDQDTAYTVTLENVEVSGTLRDFEYEVVLFDVGR